MGAGGAPRGTRARLGFRVLGSIEVVDRDHRPVGLGGPKERLVLAVLLAHANTTVSRDALIEGVWAGASPRSAERTLRSYVARLRGALAPDDDRAAGNALLATEGRGYRLNVGTAELDALLFEELARRGAAELRRGDAAASRTLRDALGLWAGAAYAEFADEDAIAPEARRLDELRLVAIEDRVEADLAGGRAAELVGEVDRLVAEHPFRERLWCQLMLALYRAGRQRDALAAFQRARSVLVEELGIEPGPELRRIEAAVLAQDPALDVRRPEPDEGPAGLPAALEAVGSAFVGRDSELEWLWAGWEEAAAGRGRFLSVLGPEGIGKTRLVAELARRVDADDGVVLYGRCDHAHRGARALLDQALRSAGASLSRLDGGGTEGDVAVAVARFLPTWSGGRPVLVVLDDLHLADADTLEMVADLAGWCAAEPMLVLGAFRTDGGSGSTGPHRDPEVAATQIVLGGLDQEDVGRVAALYAADDWLSGDVARLHELTAGVPLLVHEQASEWARHRAARRAEDAADRLTGARTRLAASHAEIADSVEGIGRLLDERRAQLSGRDADPTERPFDRCPYKGLARFEAADAADFFGRERLAAELVARLPGGPLVTVFGPSGSGKSSLVRAGVLPALSAGVLPGSERWRSVTMCPGARPARELARHLRPPAGVEPADRFVLFIDQFEETFTLCLDDRERDEFMARLAGLLDQPSAVVVIAVRADHLGRFAPYPALAERVTSNDVLVGPMRDHELRRVIEQPARRAGLELEPGLAEIIVTDVAGRGGALPLLSTALAETWERRQGQTLSIAGYRAAGGVNGALARMAEDAYLALPEESRAAARRILLRLSDAGDDGAIDLRRRLPVADLAPEGDAEARAALEILVDRRLLTVDRDTVEVAHEALLREWPRLRTWLEDDVQGRRVHRRLGDAAHSWEASARDPSGLYRGTHLDGAVEWAAGHTADLNDIERAFLDASRAEADREAADARRRIADKARSNRRLRVLLAGVAVLLVIALIAGGLFLRQRDRADRAARTAQAGQLASQSANALEEDPELGMLLALSAIDRSRSAGEPPLPEALGALQQAVQTSRLMFQRAEGSSQVDGSADGTMVASASVDPAAAILWDAATGEQLLTLTDPDEVQVADVGFSPDGRRLAVTYGTEEGGGAPPAVIVWDTATGEPVARLHGPAGWWGSPAFSRDGRSLAAVSGDGRMVVWDAASGVERSSIGSGTTGFGLVFAADGASLLVAEPAAERLAFYSIAGGHELGAMPTPGFQPESIALDPAGGRIALASQASSAVQLWDLGTHELLQSIPSGDVGPVDWSPDGRLLAIAGANQATIRVLDPDTGRDVITLAGHRGTSWDVAFTGDGTRLASVGDAGDLRVWDVTPDGPPQIGALAVPPGDVWSINTSPDGSEITVVADELAMFATATGERLATLADQFDGFPFGSAVISTDGRQVASVGELDGRGAVRELPSLATVASLPPCTKPLAFTPAGEALVLNGQVLCNPELGYAVDPVPGADLRSRVVEIASGREILDLGERPIHTAAFNPAGRFPAGRYLAVNDDYGAIEIHDMDTGELAGRHEFSPEFVFGPSFDPQGRWLTGATDAYVWVLDVAAFVGGTPWDEALVMNQPVHAARVPGPTISADGILATRGFGDGIVRLWAVATADMLAELRVDKNQAFTVAFSPDGDHLFYADAGSIVRRYPVDVDELIELAESRLTRGFTAEECRQYLDSAECP
jgi:DNA-binding SARP family transcriptional activator/WD40 repeat protein